MSVNLIGVCRILQTPSLSSQQPTHSILATHSHAYSHGIRISSFIFSCSNGLSNALAHCAPLLATAGTPMPAVVESPQR